MAGKAGALLWKNLAWIAVAVLLCLLVPPGADLWEGLAGPRGWLEAGWLGALIWRGAYGFGGVAAIGLLRALWAALLAAFVLNEAGREGEREPASGPEPTTLWMTGIALAVSACLMPWGPGALLFVLLPLALFLWRRSQVAAFALCFAWPSLDGLFPVGVLLAATLASRGGKRSPWWLLLAPLLNPAGLLAIVRGDFLAPFAASWIGHPGYVAASPVTPVFWLALACGAALFAAVWTDARELAGGVAALAAGIACRPFAGLPPLLSARRAGTRAVSAGAALLPLPFLIWLLLSKGPAPPPERAVEALKEMPSGTVAILAEPAWRGRISLAVGREEEVRVLPEPETRDLLAFRALYPTGLKPPFKGDPQPGADVLLVRPAYPDVPFPRELQEGWRLVSAGSGFALFARRAGNLAQWAGKKALAFYDPYLPLPEDPGARREALDEAAALAKADTDFFEALRDSGRMETDFRMYDRAEAHLRRAVALRPRDAKVRNDLGVVLQFEGKTEEAREAFLKSLELAPRELMPRMNLAGLDLSTGNADEAQTVLSGIVETYPGFFPARRMLAQVFLARGKKAEALKVLEGIPQDSRSPEENAILAEGQKGEGKP